MHILILGGGSAGCVVAARLSENPDIRVTLVEAGRNLTQSSMDPHVRSRYVGRAYLDERNIWPELKALFGSASGRKDLRSPERRYEQARVLGGGSVINAMTSNRGSPQDYAEWVEEGATGWSFEDVLPYFKKLETDRDFSGPFHGNDGPLTIRRISDERMSPFVKALGKTLQAKGVPPRNDQNAEWESGLYRCAVSLTDGDERNPVSVAYLTEAVRARPNLRIITDQLVERLRIVDGRVVGACLAPLVGGEAHSVFADQVIVSCGAIFSPALLMRSGIGPAAHLRQVGVDPVVDLPGVGQNLREHPSTGIAAYLPPEMRANLAEHHDQMVWRLSSNTDGVPQGDIHVGLFSRTGWHPIGQRLGALFFWINKSFSKGVTQIRSADPRQMPFVDLNLLSDSRDLARARYAFRQCADALSSLAQSGSVHSPFPASYSPRAASVAAPGLVGTVARTVFPLMLDYSGPLRSRVLESFVTGGNTLQDLGKDDDRLDDYLRANVGGTWHASGTCRMGRRSDPKAVTDASGRVFGVEGLRIVDASLMPAIPCANTNIPTVMIAEKLSDSIKHDLR